MVEYQGERRTIRARYVVGCEGERSLVAKEWAGYVKDKNHYCAALRAYYTGVTGCHSDNYIELHFLKDILPGYLWIFPMSNGRFNVGIGMASHRIAQRKVNLKTARDGGFPWGASVFHCPAKDSSWWVIPAPSSTRLPAKALATP
jgi:flavin-dependent dehydrogenase